MQACVALHNFLMKKNGLSRTTYNPPGYIDHEDWQGNVIPGAWRAEQPALEGMEIQGHHSSRDALEVRHRLAEYFVTEGAVPWQDKIVTRAG